MLGRLDINSLFTSIPLKETITNNLLFKNSDIVHGLKKNKFKYLLSLATKNSYFIFNILYKQSDVLTMGSPLGPLLGNAFLAHHEQNWLDSCFLEYRPLYYR